MIERVRIIGVVLIGVITGLVVLIAVARPLSPGEVALIISGEGPRLVHQGWVVELPGREIEYYRLNEMIHGKALLVSADGVPLCIEWSARRILDPERLPQKKPPMLPRWDRLLPGLCIESTLVRLGGDHTFEEIYGTLRPWLTRRVLEEVEPFLDRWAVGLEELRLTSVLPPGTAGERLEVKPSRILIIALDNLDPETVERLLGDGRLPVLSGLREYGALIRLENTRPGEPGRFWEELLTGGLTAGDWIERRARRGWPTGIVNSPRKPTDEGQTAPVATFSVEDYTGPVYAPPDPRLLSGETGLDSAVLRAIEGSRAVGALFDAGAVAVLWGADLFLRYYDALWPLVQRYRSVGYGERFPAEVHLDERDLIRAAEFGALVERLLTALDHFLGELLDRCPDLTLAVVSSGGYGPRPPDDLSSVPWGPTGEAWLLLAGPHIRPLGEREGTVNGAAMLLGELVLVERLSETDGIGEREILEPLYRDGLTLCCPPPPTVDTEGGGNYTHIGAVRHYHVNRGADKGDVGIALINFGEGRMTAERSQAAPLSERNTMKLIIAVALAAVVLVACDTAQKDAANEATAADYNAAEKAYASAEKAYAAAQKDYTITQEEFVTASLGAIGAMSSALGATDAAFDAATDASNATLAVGDKALQAAGDALTAAYGELLDANTARIKAFAAVADDAAAKEFSDASDAQMEAFVAEVKAEAAAADFEAGD